MNETRFMKADDEARRQALEKAVAVRRHRSEMKRKLKNGEISLQEVFDDPLCARLRAHELIASLPGVGTRRATDIQLELHMQPTRRVGGLGIRQREKLVELAERARGIRGGYAKA